MTVPKTVGQIAHENRLQLMLTEPIPWSELSAWRREDCESMARAVALECLRLCEAELLADPCKGEDEAYQRGVEHCAAAIREAIRGAISCSSKEAP